ncbi:MAG TPA: ATP-binding cassette domain-containing protein [Rhizomicrobium sp.]|nr:ATP-binding cassette domain-containing protein [Rhizomicrobium sp.]
MIELRHVSKRIRSGKGWITAVSDLSLRVEMGDRIAILGPSASGKSTALRLLNGADEISSGTAVRDLRASWPIPQSTFLNGILTVVANARFIARLYGMNQERYLEQVLEFSELKSQARSKVASLTGLQRNQLGFALGLFADFDVYLFDESIGVGGVDFREKCTRAIKYLASTRSIVIATGSPAIAKEYCDQSYVINRGVSTYYNDMDEACSVLEALKAATKAEKAEEAQAQPEEEKPDDLLEFL